MRIEDFKTLRRVWRDLGYTRARVEQIAFDLQAVGLHPPATALFDVVTALQNNAEALDKAINATVYNEVKEAEQASINVLKGVLAGMDIAAKPKEP